MTQVWFLVNQKLIIVQPINLLLTLASQVGKGALWLRRKLHALEILCEFQNFNNIASIWFLISHNP